MNKNTYEEEIFKFFSDEKNFENLLKLYGIFPKVKEKIIEKFIEKFIDQSNEKINQNQKKFHIERNKINPKIIDIYKPEWKKDGQFPPLCFCYYIYHNHPYFGIKHFSESKSLLFSDAISHRSLLGNIDFMKDLNLTDDDGIYIAWKRNSLAISNFTQDEFLKNLLPLKNSWIIDGFVGDIEKIVENGTQFVEEILNQY